MKRACIVHDWVNLVLVPIIGVLTIAGLTGHLDPAHVTHVFLAYVVGDFVWVAVQPAAVPSLPTVILAHHFVTFVLLLVPLRHPHLHLYTCVDGLVELNTFFLIARRQWRSRVARQVFSWLYWTSFLTMRMVLYPLMVPVFWHEMRAVEGAAMWETLTCVGAQVILCCFNVVLLALSVMNWRKRRGGHASSPEQRKDAAAGLKAAAAAAPGGHAAIYGGLKRRSGAVAAAAGRDAHDSVFTGKAAAVESAPSVTLKARAI